MRCPNCNTFLKEGSLKHQLCQHCPWCHGVSLSVGSARKLCGDKRFLSILWQTARRGYSNPGRKCHYCERPMRAVNLPLSGSPIELDVCTKCSIIWFDPGEFEKLPEVVEQSPDSKLRKKKTQTPDMESKPVVHFDDEEGLFGIEALEALDDKVDENRFIARFGIPGVWGILKIIQFFADYHRLRGKNDFPDYDRVEKNSYEETNITQKKQFSSKDYEGDYYRMD